MNVWVVSEKGRELACARVHKVVAPTRSLMKPAHTDSNLARGMDLALTVGVFAVIGVLLDRWLGTAPLCTIAAIVIVSVGQFVRMKYAYDAAMEQLEAERRAAHSSRTAQPAAGGEA